MSDIIEEAKEDYRIEQILNFVKKYANWLISGVLSLFIGTGGYLFWQHVQDKKMLQNAERFDQAIRSLSHQKGEDAIKALEELQISGNEGFALVSSFRLAKREGLPSEERAKLYKAIAQNKSFEQKYRDLALVHWGYQTLDEGDASGILKEMAPLLNANNPWVSFALEISALAHLKLGEANKAEGFLRRVIEDEKAPFALRQRAVAYFQQLTIPKE